MFQDPTDTQVRDLLKQAQSVAVIGVSARPDRASHQVAAYLIEQTHFDVYLINPVATEPILGQQVYACLADLPITPDIIDVFRKSEDMPAEFDKQISALGDHAAGHTWWMQLGIRNDEVAQAASDLGMNVVMDRCIKVDYANLLG